LFLLMLMHSPSVTGQSAGADPSNPLARANEWHTQASDLEAKGQWREAAVLRKQIAQLVESRLGPDHPDTDTVRWNLANTLLASGQAAAARQAYEQCLQARTKALGPGAYTVTEVQLRIVDTHLRERQPEAALTTVRAARAELEAHLTQATQLAGLVNKEIAILRSLNRTEEAARVYPDSIRRVTSTRGADDLEVLILRRNHALDLAASNQNAAAEQVILDLRQRLEATARTAEPLYLALLSDLGTQQQDLGDLASARATFEKALTAWIAKFGANTPMVCSLQERLALLALASGDLDRAQQLLANALAARRRLAEGEPARNRELAEALVEWAKFDRALGRYAEADRHLADALDIQRRSSPKNDPVLAETFEQGALLQEALGQLTAAQRLHQDALRVRLAAYGENHLAVARSRNNLARLLSLAEQFAAATRESDAALAATERVAGPESLHTAQAAFINAGIRHRAGDLAGAAPRYERALRGLSLNRSRHEAVAARDAAFLELDRERYEPALELAARSLRVQEDLWWNVLRFGSEPDRLAWRGFDDLLSLLGTLAARDPAPLATAILRLKGAVLDSLAEDRQLAMAGGAGVSTEVGALLQARRARYRLELAAYSRTPPTAGELQAARQRVESLESSLARQFTAVGESRRAFTVTLSAVRAKLPADTTLVEYVRYRHWLGQGRTEPRYGALLIHREAPLRWMELGAADGAGRINAHVAELQAAMHQDTNPPPATLQAVLRSLHDQVWAKVHEALPSGTRWVIVAPDGELGFVPFAALWRNDRFVGQDLFFRYVTSARDVLTPAAPEPTTKTMDLWADPEYARPAWKQALQTAANAAALWTVKALRGGGVVELPEPSQALPWSRKEAEAVARIARGQGWGPVGLFAGSDASEGRLRQRPAPQVLHLATHGSFLPDAPPQPYETITAGPTRPEAFRNPMTRAWLTLARANETLDAWRQGTPPDPADDGLVTAEEIAGMDLRATWLVTLSACDTGLGAARAAEGVFGLRRAFALAGARHLVSTLWPVSDLTSGKFMEAFYADALKTGDAPGALAWLQRSKLAEGTGGGFFANAVRDAGVYVLNSRGL
jgi:CHAT domain-containing protein